MRQLSIWLINVDKSSNNNVILKSISALSQLRTVGEGVRERDPVTGQLLKCPELVDTVEYGLGSVYQPTAHLLQVPQNRDVTV